MVLMRTCAMVHSEPRGVLLYVTGTIRILELQSTREAKEHCWCVAALVGTSKFLTATLMLRLTLGAALSIHAQFCW